MPDNYSAGLVVGAVMAGGLAGLGPWWLAEKYNRPVLGATLLLLSVCFAGSGAVFLVFPRVVLWLVVASAAISFIIVLAMPSPRKGVEGPDAWISLGAISTLLAAEIFLGTYLFEQIVVDNVAFQATRSNPGSWLAPTLARLAIATESESQWAREIKSQSGSLSISLSVFGVLIMFFGAFVRSRRLRNASGLTRGASSPHFDA